MPLFFIRITIFHTYLLHNSKYERLQGYAYAICLKENNFPIGYINVSMEENHDFGYGLRKEFWHRGIITEAAKTVVEQVKKDGLPYITATHDRHNPSPLFLKRIGQLSAIQKDTLRLSEGA